MALDQSALLEVLDALKAAEVCDRVRQAVESVYQGLIEAELADTIGADLDERTDTRTNLRNGHGAPGAVHDGGGLGAADPDAAQGDDHDRADLARRASSSLAAMAGAAGGGAWGGVCGGPVAARAPSGISIGDPTRSSRS
jgi:Transposase, Mutator family